LLSIQAAEEIWPLKQVFRISRGSRSETRVVVVTVTDGHHTGRGEAVPIARYNQTPASVIAQIESFKTEKDLDRHRIQELLPAGAARNALDCASWDLEAKTSGKRVWELANIPIVHFIETSFTISLDTPAKMGAAVGRSHCNARMPCGLGDDHHWPLAGQPFLPVDVQVRSTSPVDLRLILKTSPVALDVEATSYSPAAFSSGVEGVAEP